MRLLSPPSIISRSSLASPPCPSSPRPLGTFLALPLALSPLSATPPLPLAVLCPFLSVPIVFSSFSRLAQV